MMPKIWAQFQPDHPKRGGVGSNQRFSTNISLYLTNAASYGDTVTMES